MRVKPLPFHFPHPPDAGEELKGPPASILILLISNEVNIVILRNNITIEIFIDLGIRFPSSIQLTRSFNKEIRN
jgi:hypothetical protein